MICYIPSISKFTQPTDNKVSKFLATVFSTKLGYNPRVTTRTIKTGADSGEILRFTFS